MAVVGEIKVRMKPVNQILKDKGLTAGGDVQRFHTANVLRRIVKYMPYRTGATIKLTQAQSPISGDAVNTFVPYARFLHEGKLMVDPVTGAAGFMDKDGQWKSRRGVNKVKSNRPITYTTTKNPLAGPFWGRRLMAEEGDAMLHDLKNYVRRREGTK